MTEEFNTTFVVPNDTWAECPNVVIVRGDLIHPIVSGNKLYKLEPHFKNAKNLNKSLIVSVGGRYSNHLHALAWMGNDRGIATIGFVRSYSGQSVTPTMLDCAQWGMQLKYIEPRVYDERYETSFWSQIEKDYPDSYAIAEGGWSEDSILGSSQWWSSIPIGTNLVVTAVGSGTTLAGLLLSAPQGVKVVGVPVYRDPTGYQDLRDSLHKLGISPSQYELWPGYAGKGFGRSSAQLKQFADAFWSQTGVQLDPVYNVKSFHALHDKLLNQRAFGDLKIAILHTGGLQGLRS